MKLLQTPHIGREVVRNYQADLRNNFVFRSDHPPATQGGITAQKQPKIRLKWPKNRFFEKLIDVIASYPPNSSQSCGDSSGGLVEQLFLLVRSSFGAQEGITDQKQPSIRLKWPKNVFFKNSPLIPFETNGVKSATLSFYALQQNWGYGGVRFCMSHHQTQHKLIIFKYQGNSSPVVHPATKENK